MIVDQRTFNKKLVSIKAFLPDDKHLENIITMCNLVPTDDWKIWTDEISSLLIAKTNKNIRVKKINPLNINKQIVKDIYFKSHPKQIYNNSNVVMFVFLDKNNANIPDSSFVLFVGEDKKIRLSCYIKDEWYENRPPLTAGTLTLRTIIDNKDIDSYKIYNGSRYAQIPNEGIATKVWISKVPIHNNVILDMLITNRTLSQKILKDLGAI
jgi:hypothetical protein